jgi:hypothetical protein
MTDTVKEFVDRCPMGILWEKLMAYKRQCPELTAEARFAREETVSYAEGEIELRFRVSVLADSEMACFDQAHKLYLWLERLEDEEVAISESDPLYLNDQYEVSAFVVGSRADKDWKGDPAYECRITLVPDRLTPKVCFDLEATIRRTPGESEE